MDGSDLKVDLLRYLQKGREARLWTLEGLSEYDIRRPMVRTGTDLLGLVKHVATMDAGYLGAVFDRPFAEPFPWTDEDAEPNADSDSNGSLELPWGSTADGSPRRSTGRSTSDAVKRLRLPGAASAEVTTFARAGLAVSRRLGHHDP